MNTNFSIFVDMYYFKIIPVKHSFPPSNSSWYLTFTIWLSFHLYLFVKNRVLFRVVRLLLVSVLCLCIWYYVPKDTCILNIVQKTINLLRNYSKSLSIDLHTVMQEFFNLFIEIITPRSLVDLITYLMISGAQCTEVLALFEL